MTPRAARRRGRVRSCGGPSSVEILGLLPVHAARSLRARLGACPGQSSIEVLGLLPILAAVVLAAAQLLAAGAARTAASFAAEAAAMAVVRGADPTAAARAAAPGWSRDRLSVLVTGRHVHVRVTPPGLVPGAPDLLIATADADAGPAA